jgi:acetoacetyl-CoA synthetase
MNGTKGTSGHLETGVNGSNGMHNGSKLLWRHPAPMTTPMFKFLEQVNLKYGLQIDSYEELHKWSVEHVGKFWGRAWTFVGIKAKTQASRAVVSYSFKRSCMSADSTIGSRREGAYVSSSGLLRRCNSQLR